MSNNKQMSIEKEFIPYEEALALKKLGFNETCFATWNGETLDMSLQIPSDDYFTKAPTFSQAFRWFDENTDLMGFVVPSIKDNHFDWLIRVDWEQEVECEEAYALRHEAELACLRKLIEIVKEKHNVGDLH